MSELFARVEALAKLTGTEIVALWDKFETWLKTEEAQVVEEVKKTVAPSTEETGNTTETKV